MEVFDRYYEDSDKYRHDMELLSHTGTLSEGDLMELSTPLDYSDIKFETETYRSGKKHIKKTRYKANPWGEVIGRHEGAQFYTNGQRKGLAIGGHKEPLFVIHTDIARNTVFVGEGEHHKGLSRSCLWIAPKRFTGYVRSLRWESESSAATRYAYDTDSPFRTPRF